MSNLAILGSGEPLRSRRVHVTLNEPAFSLFFAFPTSGGVLFGIPSQSRGEYHYHLQAKQPPGSTAWRLTLLRTLEPGENLDKGHEVVWETPPISGEDIKAWGEALARRFGDDEQIAAELRESGLRVSAWDRLQREGWQSMDAMARLLRRMEKPGRLVVAFEDLLKSPAPAHPDILYLPSPTDPDDFEGIAFRLLKRPEGAFADALSPDLRADIGPFYLVYMRSMLAWLGDLLASTALEVFADKGIRDRLHSIKNGIALHRQGQPVNWEALIAR